MTDFTLSDGVMDEYGNFYLDEDTATPQPALTRFPGHGVYTKFENSLTPATYDYDIKIVLDSLVITESTSELSATLEEPTFTKLSQYDANQGINYASYVKGRQYIIVTSEDMDNLPDDGDPYDNQHQVIFSGYSLKGGAIDLKDVSFAIKYVGVENLLNEIKISGCYIEPIRAGTLGNTTARLSNSKCIFNENSRKDRASSFASNDTYGPLHGAYKFNKSGIGQTEYWNITQILRYVVAYYTRTDSPLIALDTNGIGAKLIANIAQYITWEWYQIDDLDLEDIQPMDFSIENLGVFEALLLIIKETKKYILYKAYASNGKVGLSLRDKRASSTYRADGDLAMLLDIGALNATNSSLYVINNGNISLNRETKNIGRVIVMGDFLRINSLATTMGYSGSPTFTSNFSSDPDTYSPAGGLLTFLDRLSLVLTDTNYTETYQQNYAVTPENLLNVTLADLTVDLTAYNGEPTTLNIFETLKCLEFTRDLSKGVSKDSSKSIRDCGVYIAKPSEPRTGVADEYDWIYPLSYDGSNYYYYMVPIEKLSNSFGAKHDDGMHSALIIYEANGDPDNETGYTEFGQYWYNSAMLFNDIGAFHFTNYNLTNPIPMIARVNVKTDYRIKGIADLGVDYDENVHSTVIVLDEDFKLTIQYKDAEYSAGAFTNLTNGYIDASDSNVLERIQYKADSLLAKYKVMQNSGHLLLDGYQYVWKVGDWTNKITGTSRDINTPLICSGVEFNFKQKTTTLKFGT